MPTNATIQTGPPKRGESRVRGDDRAEREQRDEAETAERRERGVLPGGAAFGRRELATEEEERGRENARQPASAGSAIARA